MLIGVFQKEIKEIHHAPFPKPILVSELSPFLTSLGAHTNGDATVHAIAY